MYMKEPGGIVGEVDIGSETLKCFFNNFVN